MILVTGGTGFLGSYLVKYLVKAQRPVRLLVRPTSDLSVLEEYRDRVEVATGDVLDVMSLEDAMQGVSQIYHVAASVSFDPRKRDQLYKVNVEGTANVVNQALYYGVDKLLHVSSIAAIGRPEGIHHIDETLKWEKSAANTNYGISKFLAEKEVWRGTAEGLKAVIVNPSVILGAGRWNTGTANIFHKINNGFPFYTTGTNGFVDVRDVARASVDLMESDIINQRFILSAENRSYKELFFGIAEALGTRKPFIKGNKVLMNIAWPVESMKSMITGHEPTITRETIRVTLRNNFYSNSKIKQALNYTFTGIDETIRETAALLQQSIHQNTPFATLPL